MRHVLRWRCDAWLVALALLSGAPATAHEPHKQVPAPGGATTPTPIPLPEGWRESRPPAGPGAFAPMLIGDGDGFLASWIEPLPESAHRVRFAGWQAGKWGAATTVREARTLFANWADVPGVARAADGALYAWWLERSGAGTYTYDVRLARSTDQGMSFAALGLLHEDRTPAEHGFVSAVREGNGVRFYYLDGRATPGDKPMQLRTVFVEGTRIAPSELVDASVCDCCSTAAVALAGGSAVAYRDRSESEIRDILVALRPLTGAPMTRPVGNDQWKIAGCPVNGPALAGESGNLAVAWFAAPDDRPRLAVARSADNGATWSPSQALPAAKPMGQLAIAQLDGGFALSWLEAIAGGSELRLARLDRSGRLETSFAIARAGAGRAAGAPRLAAAGNRLALLWVDSGNPATAGLRCATQAP